MTLVTSSPSTILDPKTKYEDEDPHSDTNSQSSDDDQTAMQSYNPMDCLVQSLGFPGDKVPPQFGKVSIEHSTDVHFGDKNIYQGPVTIKQIVYANGTPLVPISDSSNDKLGCRENLGFEESDSDNVKDSVCVDLKASDKKQDCDIKDVNGGQGGEGGTNDLPVLRKGYLWLQNVSKKRPIEIGFFVGVVLLFLVILVVVLILRHPSTTNSTQLLLDTDEQNNIEPVGYDSDITATSQIKNKLRIVSRYQWVAQPPVNTTTPLVTPVPYVIIHHTATENCSSIASCAGHIRYIQTFHIESQKFYDIGYNFLVGGEGSAYMGRGWTVEGAHAYGYNARSIGIAFIGTFINIKPPEIQILACKKLIQMGVDEGYIKKDYKLLAARQLSGTESPGAALYENMKTWPHWAKEP